MNHSVLRFRKFPVVKEVMHKRGGEFQDFLSKKFCLTVPKIFVGRGESFSASITSGIEKVWTRGGRGVSSFSVEVFVSLHRNISLENTLVLFQKNSFIENFHA